MPGSDHVTNEVHTARHRLKDGFRWIEPGMQPIRQECIYTLVRGMEPLRRLVQQDEVIHVANVVPRADLVLRKLI
jgi:hypothetical protein